MRQRASMNISRTQNPWIPYRRFHPDSVLKLFCFPYAGGSASIFRGWFDALPEWVDVCPIQLPGREGRLMEKPYTSLKRIVEELVDRLASETDHPYAVFGHSMGALIGFEFARAFSRKGKPPLKLFVSGRNAPQCERRNKMIHLLPEHEFLEELKRLNGTPEQVLENKELMELLMPIVRADFAVFETYQYEQGPPLSCPIIAFGGLVDPEVTREQLEAWSEHTVSRFQLKMLPGDHFFLHQMKDELVNAIVEELDHFRQAGGDPHFGSALR